MECIRALTDQAALKSVASLFQNWQETLIWSALEGIMGQVWVCADAEETAQVAACQTGDFLFLAGDAHSPQARRFLQGFTDKTDDSFFIAVPQNPAWSDLICSLFGDRARPGERYAIRKEGDVFDREHLQRLTGMIPDCVSIKPIRGQLYHQVMEEKWSRDFCSQFPSCFPAFV